MKPIIAYADVGSHGGIFKFDGGAIAQRYPDLLHIHYTRVTPDLVPVLIVPLEDAIALAAKQVAGL